MNLSKSRLILAFVIVISILNIAGCIRSGPIGCEECGCHYSSTHVSFSPQIALTLNRTGKEHMQNFTTADFTLTFRFGGGEIPVKMEYLKVIDNPSNFTTRLGYKPVYLESNHVALPDDEPAILTITLGVESDDPYISSFNFMGDGNTLLGTIAQFNDGSDLNVSFEKDYQGVTPVNYGNGGANIKFDSGGWAFEVSMENSIMCVD